MKKSVSLILSLIMVIIMGGCRLNENDESGKSDSTMKQELLDAATQLEPSEILYFEDGFEIDGMGLNWSGGVVEYDDNYYWPAVETKTGVHLNIKWKQEDGYVNAVSATLLSSDGDMPDIINANDLGIMDLVTDGAIVPLEDYLYLMPDIVKAVGPDRMDSWVQPDGHIYAIPNIVNVQGAKTMMVRKDWLDKLGMDEPNTWEDWKDLWRAIRDNDLNENGDPNDEIPFACQYGPTGEMCLAPLLDAFGIKSTYDSQFCILEDGTYTMIYEHPRYNEFLQEVHSLYEEGLIDPEFDSREQDDLYKIMDSNVLGTTYTWAEKCRLSSDALREKGVSNALWKACYPIAGPDGCRMTPERNMVSNKWCITKSAADKGKVEDIIRFFNWCFTEEGSYLYSYGIEGVSYEYVNGKPVLYDEMTQNGFVDYRSFGCDIDSFGGLWQEDAYIQCLFEGKKVSELDATSKEFYNGIEIVNKGYYYTQYPTLATDAYHEYRGSLIVDGVCKDRDAAIKGEITIDRFWQKYESYKEKGLDKVIIEGQDAQKKMK